MTQQTWQRMGRLFEPKQQRDWLHSHAANPLPFPLADGRVRIYFNYRDMNNCSGISWLDWQPSLDGPGQVLSLAPMPVLLPGSAGLYDDSGVSLGCITAINDKLWLYYIGWNLGVTVPWRNSIGFAIGELDGVFHRPMLVPILDRHEQDPYSLSYPWVIKSADNCWHMWYGSNLGWGKDQASMHHVLKYAHSQDGINWQRTGQICLDLLPGEIGLSRPCVYQDGSLWRMWYAIRGEKYSVGYAESHDGLKWIRRDELISWAGDAAEWESEEQAYPCVFPYGETWYMFYNGNKYGATGFGVAKLLV